MAWQNLPLLIMVLLLRVPLVHGEAPEVKIEGIPGAWQLNRGGQPYFIRGAGGDGSPELLAQLGGNSIRTWGHDGLGEILDKAQELGLTVTAGIWLGQVRQGFDWSDTASLKQQRETIRAVVDKHKNHPALLMWGLGNEMEDAEGRNSAVWSEINELARLVKSLDSRHPTMTVIAELGGDKVRNLHKFCPDIDVVGVNSYGGAATVGRRYRELGGTKPYVLTEFGPPGIWEIQKNEIGAYPELTSTAKAQIYRATYREAVAGQAGMCLGSYAFVWGQKQEVTATWFSLLLKDGSRLAAVDVLSELWTGKSPVNRCPTVDALTLTIDGKQKQSAMVKPGTTIRLDLKARDPERDTLDVTWQLFADSERYGAGGDAEGAVELFTTAIVRSDATSAEVQLPSAGGLYRIFATVRDSHGGAAVANVPVRVDAPIAIGTPAKLPLTIYSETDGDDITYTASGWMGDTKSIVLDTSSTERPQSGKTSLRCEFNATSGWGAVAWQHPAEDWGDRRGGFDLTGAKRLVFYARGKSGGEEVTFGFGLIGSDKRYFDTAKRSLKNVKLTTEWQRFEIPSTDSNSTADLTRIKTGFVWTVESPGHPVVFFLDDIHWE